MSVYKDYNAVEVCRNYDRARLPFGAEDIVKRITTETSKKAADLHVLDAGCGTGNYARELLKLGVGKCSMFDASHGMLTVAKEKVELFEKDGRVPYIKHGFLPSIPFEDETFDAVMYNMVLHHIENHNTDDSSRFNVLPSVFKDTARVLKPGGVIVITTRLPMQYFAIWYANVMPEVTKRMGTRLPSSDQFNQMLGGCFKGISIDSILGVGWSNDYWNPDGPLKKELRDLDSYWSTFSEAELKEAVDKIQDMKDKGTLKQYMEDNDGSMTTGQVTLVSAVKA